MASLYGFIKALGLYYLTGLLQMTYIPMKTG